MTQEFITALASFQPQFQEPLKNHTTWKIGGPATVLIETQNSQQLQEVLTICHQFQVRPVILGNGSNILVSDRGIDNLVIINKSKTIEILDQSQTQVQSEMSTAEAENYNLYIPHRHLESGDQSFYSFADLDYTESGPRFRVRFDSGVLLSYAIAWTLKNELTGLQWFAGIPGTMGGSLYNNIHGGTKHFSDNFESAQVFNWQTGEVQILNFEDFHFGYDQSLLRGSHDYFVLSVTLKLFRGDAAKGRFVAQEWLKRKMIQPKISCGSVFQCISDNDQQRLGFPTHSAGYIIDKVLGLRGKRVGDVQIASNHANFIENVGPNANAVDVLSLMREVVTQTKEKTGVRLYPEINFLGFDREELQGIVAEDHELFN